MTKEEAVKRIKELAKKLGRKPDITGSEEEILLRVQEWEAEMDIQHEGAGEEQEEQEEQEDTGATKVQEASSGGVVEGKKEKEKSETKPQGGLVLIRALCTLHIQAWHPESKSELEMVKKGELALVSSSLLDDIASGLLEKA